MMLKTLKPSVFVVLVLAMAFSASPAQASSTSALQRAAFVAEPSAGLCDIAVADAQQEFALYVSHDQDGKARGALPADVAAVHFKSVYNSCYHLPTAAELAAAALALVAKLPGTIAAADELCSGGGSSVVGMTDFITLLGAPYPVVRGPGSSYWTWYNDDTGDFGVGHTNSLISHFEGDANSSGGGSSYYWWFTSVPMGGSGDLSSHCLGPLVTSTSVSLIGTPLGLPISNVLGAAFSGTTCLVPC